MKNILDIGIISLMCLFLLASCSHEKLFTQKKYQELRKVPVSSIEAKYQNNKNQKENYDKENINTKDENIMASASSNNAGLSQMIRSDKVKEQINKTKAVFKEFIPIREATDNPKNIKKIDVFKMMHNVKKLKKPLNSRDNKNSFLRLILFVILILLVIGLVAKLFPDLAWLLEVLILVLLIVLILYLLKAL
ncbi:MAG: hypothetical protein WC223_09925 [Bacteroidales bacterium]|jgi:Flp pilus assembly protein TadB